MAAHPSSQCLLLDALAAGQSRDRDGSSDNPAGCPQRKPEASVEVYVHRHCRAELCVEETLGKTGRVQQMGQFCGSLNSAKAPMCTYALLKYPWSPGPARRKHKAEGPGGLQATLNVLLHNWLTMPKPALDFTAQKTVRCLMTEETCWEATVQVEVGFSEVLWKAAVVTGSCS